MNLKTLALCFWTFLATAVMADPVNEFSLPDLSGKQHTLAPYQGKWIIINYWATNCAPCLQEIPELEAFHNRHKDTDAVVLGVNYEDIKLSWLKDFVASVKMTYPVLLTKPDTVTPFGPIMMLPTTIIVAPDGRLMGQQRGAVTAEMLDKYIDSQRNSTAEGT